MARYHHPEFMPPTLFERLKDAALRAWWRAADWALMVIVVACYAIAMALVITNLLTASTWTAAWLDGVWLGWCAVQIARHSKVDRRRAI